MPNIVLVGTGSGVVGDGGTFGLDSGEGHKMEDVTDEAEPIDCPSPCGSFPDSSCGSTTVGSGSWESSSHPLAVTQAFVKIRTFIPIDDRQLSLPVKDGGVTGEARSYACKDLAEAGVGAKMISYS